MIKLGTKLKMLGMVALMTCGIAINSGVASAEGLGGCSGGLSGTSGKGITCGVAGIGLRITLAPNSMLYSIPKHTKKSTSEAYIGDIDEYNWCQAVYLGAVDKDAQIKIKGNSKSTGRKFDQSKNGMYLGVAKKFDGKVAVPLGGKSDKAKGKATIGMSDKNAKLCKNVGSKGYIWQNIEPLLAGNADAIRTASLSSKTKIIMTKEPTKSDGGVWIKRKVQDAFFLSMSPAAITNNGWGEIYNTSSRKNKIKRIKKAYKAAQFFKAFDSNFDHYLMKGPANSLWTAAIFKDNYQCDFSNMMTGTKGSPKSSNTYVKSMTKSKKGDFYNDTAYYDYGRIVMLEIMKLFSNNVRYITRTDMLTQLPVSSGDAGKTFSDQIRVVVEPCIRYSSGKIASYQTMARVRNLSYHSFDTKYYSDKLKKGYSIFNIAANKKVRAIHDKNMYFGVTRCLYTGADVSHAGSDKCGDMAGTPVRHIVGADGAALVRLVGNLSSLKSGIGKNNYREPNKVWKWTKKKGINDDGAFSSNSSAKRGPKATVTMTSIGTAFYNITPADSGDSRSMEEFSNKKGLKSFGYNSDTGLFKWYNYVNVLGGSNAKHGTKWNASFDIAVMGYGSGGFGIWGAISGTPKTEPPTPDYHSATNVIVRIDGAKAIMDSAESSSTELTKLGSAAKVYVNTVSSGQAYDKKLDSDLNKYMDDNKADFDADQIEDIKTDTGFAYQYSYFKGTEGKAVKNLIGDKPGNSFSYPSSISPYELNDGKSSSGLAVNQKTIDQFTTSGKYLDGDGVFVDEDDAVLTSETDGKVKANNLFIPGKGFGRMLGYKYKAEDKATRTVQDNVFSNEYAMIAWWVGTTSSKDESKNKENSDEIAGTTIIDPDVTKDNIVRDLRNSHLAYKSQDLKKLAGDTDSSANEESESVPQGFNTYVGSVYQPSLYFREVNKYDDKSDKWKYKNDYATKPLSLKVSSGVDGVVAHISKIGGFSSASMTSTKSFDYVTKYDSGTDSIVKITPDGEVKDSVKDGTIMGYEVALSLLSKANSLSRVYKVNNMSGQKTSVDLGFDDDDDGNEIDNEETAYDELEGNPDETDPPEPTDDGGEESDTGIDSDDPDEPEEPDEAETITTPTPKPTDKPESVKVIAPASSDVPMTEEEENEAEAERAHQMRSFIIGNNKITDTSKQRQHGISVEVLMKQPKVQSYYTSAVLQYSTNLEKAPTFYDSEYNGGIASHSEVSNIEADEHMGTDYIVDKNKINYTYYRTNKYDVSDFQSMPLFVKNKDEQVVCAYWAVVNNEQGGGYFGTATDPDKKADEMKDPKKTTGFTCANAHNNVWVTTDKKDSHFIWKEDFVRSFSGKLPDEKDFVKYLKKALNSRNEKATGKINSSVKTDVDIEASGTIYADEDMILGSAQTNYHKKRKETDPMGKNGFNGYSIYVLKVVVPKTVKVVSVLNLHDYQLNHWYANSYITENKYADGDAGTNNGKKKSIKNEDGVVEYVSQDKDYLYVNPDVVVNRATGLVWNPGASGLGEYPIKAKTSENKYLKDNKFIPVKASKHDSSEEVLAVNSSGKVYKKKLKDYDKATQYVIHEVKPSYGKSFGIKNTSQYDTKDWALIARNMRSLAPWSYLNSGLSWSDEGHIFGTIYNYPGAYGAETYESEATYRSDRENGRAKIGGNSQDHSFQAFNLSRANFDDVRTISALSYSHEEATNKSYTNTYAEASYAIDELRCAYGLGEKYDSESNSWVSGRDELIGLNPTGVIDPANDSTELSQKAQQQASIELSNDEGTESTAEPDVLKGSQVRESMAFVNYSIQDHIFYGTRWEKDVCTKDSCKRRNDEYTDNYCTTPLVQTRGIKSGKNSAGVTVRWAENVRTVGTVRPWQIQIASFNNKTDGDTKIKLGSTLFPIYNVENALFEKVYKYRTGETIEGVSNRYYTDDITGHREVYNTTNENGDFRTSEENNTTININGTFTENGKTINTSTNAITYGDLDASITTTNSNSYNTPSAIDTYDATGSDKDYHTEGNGSELDKEYNNGNLKMLYKIAVVNPYSGVNYNVVEGNWVAQNKEGDVQYRPETPMQLAMPRYRTVFNDYYYHPAWGAVNLMDIDPVHVGSAGSIDGYQAREVLTMSEHIRKTKLSSLYLVRLSKTTEPVKGVVYSDTIGSDTNAIVEQGAGEEPVIYGGSDVSLRINADNLKLQAIGYCLDLISQNDNKNINGNVRSNSGWDYRDVIRGAVAQPGINGVSTGSDAGLNRFVTENNIYEIWNNVGKDTYDKSSSNEFITDEVIEGRANSEVQKSTHDASYENFIRWAKTVYSNIGADITLKTTKKNGNTTIRAFNNFNTSQRKLDCGYSAPSDPTALTKADPDKNEIVYSIMIKNGHILTRMPVSKIEEIASKEPEAKLYLQSTVNDEKALTYVGAQGFDELLDQLSNDYRCTIAEAWMLFKESDMFGTILRSIESNAGKYDFNDSNHSPYNGGIIEDTDTVETNTDTNGNTTTAVVKRRNNSRCGIYPNANFYNIDGDTPFSKYDFISGITDKQYSVARTFYPQTLVRKTSGVATKVDDASYDVTGGAPGAKMVKYDKIDRMSNDGDAYTSPINKWGRYPDDNEFVRQSHWYDEQVRTFVVRRFQAKERGLGTLMLVDKLEYNLTSEAQQNQGSNGNLGHQKRDEGNYNEQYNDTYEGRWYLTVLFDKKIPYIAQTRTYKIKDGIISANNALENSRVTNQSILGGNVLIDNVHIDGSDFIIPDETTDEIVR